MKHVLVLSAPAVLLTGCIGVTYGRSNGILWGGGGVGLFLLIFIAALLFGRQR